MFRVKIGFLFLLTFHPSSTTHIKIFNLQKSAAFASFKSIGYGLNSERDFAVSALFISMKKLTIKCWPGWMNNDVILFPAAHVAISSAFFISA